MVRFPALVLLVSFLGLTTNLPAAAPLDAVPDTADVVIRLNSPQATVEKAAEFAESIESNTGRLVRDRADLGRYISNPSLTGVDASRDWYVAVFADSKADPAVVFIIPATDADAMQEALPENVTASVRDGWVYYSEQAEAIKSMSDPIRSESGIDSLFDEPSRTLFDEADAALFVNVDHLTKVYEGRILKMQDDVAAGLNEIAFAAPQIQGLDLNSMVDLYSDVLSGLFQALEDARGLTVGVVVGDTGADVDMYLSFGSETPTSEVLAAQPSSTMPRLAALPPKSQLYWGASGNMAGLWQWSQQMLTMLGTAEDSREKLDELSGQFDELEYQSLVGSMRVGGDGAGIMQSMSLVEVSPISSARDVMRGMTELAGGLKTEGFRQETILEREAEEFGDYTADHVIVEQSFDLGPNLPPEVQQQLEQMEQMMYGPDGNLTRYVYLDEFYLQSLGGGRRAVEEVLQQIESGESNSSAENRQELMEESNLLLLVDVPSLVNGYMGAFAGFGGGAPGLPQPAPKPAGSSYAGLAAAAETNAIRAELHVPVEQIRGILPYVALMQMMTQPQGLR